MAETNAPGRDGGFEVFKDKIETERAKVEHGVRRGEVPEFRRVLGRRGRAHGDGDDYDHGGHVHERV